MSLLERLTTRQYWEGVHSTKPRLGVPRGLFPDQSNLRRLFRRHIRKGMDVLEIGCAPGKQLSWLASVLGANVAGVDFSSKGMESARELFTTLGITGDLRCEDIFQTTFDLGRFDVVYSLGVIEHFDDPRPIVRQHVALLKPGGTALVQVPNYSGFYRRLQRHFDPENLDIHNLRIMSTRELLKLVPADMDVQATAFPWGHMSPGLVSFHKRWPALACRCLRMAVNSLGAIQLFDLKPLCPLLILRIVRGR